MSPPENTNSEKQGPFQYFTSLCIDFSDRQRLERLQQCRDLEFVLKRCQHSRNEALSEATSNGRKKGKRIARDADVEERPYQDEEIEQTIPGMRMTRYFDWRESAPQRVGGSVLSMPASQSEGGNEDKQEKVAKQSDNTKKETPATVPSTPPTCARETHSLWGCRSVALGCSTHLAKLKECFQQYDQKDVLNVHDTAYEKKSDGNSNAVPCRKVQEELGACVTQNAIELQLRQRARTSENESL